MNVSGVAVGGGKIIIHSKEYLYNYLGFVYDHSLGAKKTREFAIWEGDKSLNKFATVGI
jgi:hypothetical protein